MNNILEGEKHLSIGQLWSVKQLSFDDVMLLFSMADAFSSMNSRDLAEKSLLRGEVFTNLFFEKSTRTYLSFAIAAQKLSAQFVPLDTASSSLCKGETLADTIRNMQALGCSLMAIRHQQAGIVETLAKSVNISIVNAGDGDNEHPTQALLDAFTLWKHFGFPRQDMLRGLKVTIVGDIKHSRVAKSNMLLLPMLGAKVTVTGPASFMLADWSPYDVTLVDDMLEAITHADAVMVLRIQKERLAADNLIAANNYYEDFGLSINRLAQMPKHAVVLHPGPINRGVEIAEDVADHERSLILEQAKNGVFMRMAILHGLIRFRQIKGLMR